MKDMSDMKPDRYVGPAQTAGRSFMARNITGVTAGRPLRKTTVVAIKYPRANWRNPMRKMLVLFLIIFPVSNAVAQTPSQVYEEYNNKMISGFSFEEKLSYFSKQKSEKIQNALNEAMKKYGLSRSEAIDASTKHPAAYGKCYPITLVEEKITGDQATVTYTQKYDCEGDPLPKAPQKRRIKMVNEDGWKIDKIAMVFESGP